MLTAPDYFSACVKLAGYARLLPMARIAAKVQAFGLAWTLTSAIHPTRDNERVYTCVTPPPSFRACVEERDGQIYTDRACAAELGASR